MLKATLFYSVSIAIVASFLSTSEATNLEIADENIKLAKSIYTQKEKVIESFCSSEFKFREELVNGQKDAYLGNDELLKAFLYCNLKYLASRDSFEKYFEHVEGFIRDNRPLAAEIKEPLVSYLLKSQFEVKIPSITGNQQEAFNLCNVDILQDCLQLSGEGASIIVIENSPFTKHDSIKWFASHDDIMCEQDSHGGATSSVVASIADGATIIPVLYHAPRSKKYEQMVKEQGTTDSNNELKEYFARKNANLCCFDNEYGNFTPSLEYALLDAQTFMKKDEVPHVISMSVSNNLETFTDKNLLTLQNLLVDNDMLLVMAAGNYGGCLLSDKYTTIFQNYPDLQKHLLFVGALDNLKDIATYSDLPGSSCADDFIFASGTLKILSLEAEEGFDTKDGTSFATPTVAGTLSLLKKYFPTLNMAELKEILLSTASAFPDYTGKASSGMKQLNAFEAFMKAKEMSESKNPKKKNDTCVMM